MFQLNGDRKPEHRNCDREVVGGVGPNQSTTECWLWLNPKLFGRIKSMDNVWNHFFFGALKKTYYMFVTRLMFFLLNVVCYTRYDFYV